MRRLLVSSVLAVSFVVPAACSGGGDDSDALARLASAARQVTDSGGYRFEGTVIYSLGQGTQEIPVTGMVDTGSEGAPAEESVEPFTVMDLDLSRAPLIGARAGVTRIIIIGRTIYLRFPEGDQPGTGTAPGGKAWGKFDRDTSNQAGEGLGLLLDRGKTSVPAGSLALLTGARDVSREGTETIRDVETRHFTLTADLQEVADQAPPEFAPEARFLLDKIGPVTVSVDVWLGPDDLPRRVAYTLDPADRRYVVSSTVDLFDYGTPVERTLPAEADVFDFSALSGAER